MLRVSGWGPSDIKDQCQDAGGEGQQTVAAQNSMLSCPGHSVDADHDVRATGKRQDCRQLPGIVEDRGKD